MHWLLGTLFSLDVNLAQPRCNREGLGLSTEQGVQPSFRIGGGRVGRSVEGVGGEWKEKTKWESGLVFFK